jgi:glycerol-3-phosphate dehydrogenase
MALTLDDVLERRSRLLLWDPTLGLSVADGVARTMAGLLGWDAARTQDELARYRGLADHLKSVAPDEADAARAAHG